jgi:hypothetical protein
MELTILVHLLLARGCVRIFRGIIALLPILFSNKRAERENDSSELGRFDMFESWNMPF